MFAEFELTPDIGRYIAQGLRSLAACDGLHAAELALVDEFERSLGLEATDSKDFVSGGGGPLADVEQRELFLQSAQLLALADGRISSREREWLDRVAADLGLSEARGLELEVRAKQYLLGSLAEVRMFRGQAEGVGRALGLSAEQILAALGPAPG